MIVERLSFDSWGRRRQGDWQPMTDAAIYSFDTALTTNRGYTGHEQLDNVGLVHMNGRVYDPTLGRFLSADPHVQSPGNLQNWNRYSYVLNNPLSYTDPTGFFFNKLFKALGRAFGKLFSAIGSAFKKLLNSGILRSVIQVVGCLALPVVGCAALTAAITLAAGGSVQDALMAAAFAFAQINIYEHIVGPMLKGAHFLMQSAVHGAVGGAMAVVRGGNFLVGFAAGALGKIGSVVTRGIDNFALRLGVSAAFGCAGSMIGGGKCANGAVTAAFAHIYNEMGRTVGAIGGGWAGSAVGSAASGYCIAATAGACAPAAPWIVTGSSWIGRILGGTAGGWIDDQLDQVVPEDPDGPLVDDRGVELTHNPKHHENSKTPEPPKDKVRHMWRNKYVDDSGTGWALDENKALHRFSRPSNNMSHWNGTTANSQGLPHNSVRAVQKATGWRVKY